MLTLQDCLDMCDLDGDIVEAIAKHEHLPSILAAELAESLCQSPSGQAVLQRLIADEIACADDHGDRARVRRLHAALDQFRATHPGVPMLV